MPQTVKGNRVLQPFTRMALAGCLVSCLDCQTSGNKDVVKLVAQLACLLGHLIDAREKGGICCHASGHCLHITQQLETQVKQAGEPIWHG